MNSKILIPGSKSETNRAYLLSLLACKADQASPENDRLISVINHPLRSRDTDLMLDAVIQFGGQVNHNNNQVLIEAPENLQPGKIDCGLAGTLLRFLPPVASLISEPTLFFGDKQAQKRPIKGILEALAGLGAQISSYELPFKVNRGNNIKTDRVEIDASESSQFVSGLMLSAARLKTGVTIFNTGSKLPSRPHIQMTQKMLHHAGVFVEELSSNSWRIRPGDIFARSWEIEPDLTNAAVFCAAGAVRGQELTIRNWPNNTTQAGSQILPILNKMGAKITTDKIDDDHSTIKISAADNLNGIDINLSDIGELTPTIAALTTLATGKSHLTGIAHLRGHETDRLSALTTEINRLGGNCQETPDGLIITPTELKGGLWRTYNDHRMAMAGALIGLKYPIQIENIDTTSKTFPDFKRYWDELLSGVESIEP